VAGHDVAEAVTAVAGGDGVGDEGFLLLVVEADADAREGFLLVGLAGGWYWSDFIEVTKGGAYKVYVDAKGPGCLVFIRGYEKKVPIGFGDEEPAAQDQFRRARGDPLTDTNGRPIKYRLRYLYTTKFAAGGSPNTRPTNGSGTLRGHERRAFWTSAGSASRSPARHAEGSQRHT